MYLVDVFEAVDDAAGDGGDEEDVDDLEGEVPVEGAELVLAEGDAPLHDGEAREDRRQQVHDADQRARLQELDERLEEHRVVAPRVDEGRERLR